MGSSTDRLGLLFRYWATLRTLKVEQILYLLLRRGLRWPRRANVVASAAWNMRLCLDPGLTSREVCWLGGVRFRFLNVERDCGAGIGGLDWRQAAAPKLWRYNLHYFDWLKQPDVTPQAGFAQMRDWIARNPPVAGDGWEPYPVSLRLVNWIRFLARPEVAAPADLVASIATQADWLARNLEYHLQANHLFENARALVFAGAALADERGTRLATLGERLLRRELREQFLADGMHYERSPMYHAILTEGLLDLAMLFRANPDLVPKVYSVNLHDEVNDRARTALIALDALTLPDGEIALFNDAAFGIAPRPIELHEQGARVLACDHPEWRDWRAVALKDSGYFAIGDAAQRLVIDCGAIGPDYQPGHAHCDTLSYELAFAGRRIVVDPGNHDYEASAARVYARSTAAHNTVVIDGAEQSEIWGVFRVACRARPLYAKLQQETGYCRFSGAHDGYRRLPGAVTHHRSVTFDGRLLCVEDRIEGAGTHRAESYVHFAPGLSLRERDGVIHVFAVDGGDVAMLHVEPDANVAITTTDRYPEFGRTEQGRSVILRAEGVLPLRLSYRIERIDSK